MPGPGLKPRGVTSSGPKEEGTGKLLGSGEHCVLRAA